ncbi:MAG: HAD-IIIC family phosphatase [Sphingomonas sp.]
MSLLSWLPVLPDPGAALRTLKALDTAEQPAAAARLARHDLDAIATSRLDRFSAALPAPGGAPAVRLALIGGHTLDHLAPAIRVGGVRHGLAVTVHVGDYGQYRHALIAGDEALDAFAPSHVLIAPEMATLLGGLPISAGRREADEAIAAAIAEMRGWWRTVRRRWQATPVQQTLLPQSPPLVGSNEALLPASPAALCRTLNAAIRDAAAEEGTLLLDVAARMPAVHGHDRLFDPVRWYQAKQLINPVFAPLYGELLAQVLAAAAGRARKCLVLDLDNTMWGGVVGDDGIENLKLGQGSAEGEAYLAFQLYVRRLAERGIILAVCSKNDHDVARAVFDRHPEMQLGYGDIACFVCNWSDKAGNIRAIARQLNIGTDALVFVDDNPAERAIVRRELPEVAVPELPDDVAFYPERIAAAGYFEAAAITGDDFGRGRSYAANNARTAALDEATDMEGFLRSLEMKLVSGPVTPIDRPRAAQLINKSNQFNLTTRRRSEAELEQVMHDPGAVALAFRLRDRFGDNGLISVIISRRDAAWPDDSWLIDTWLMSCRVLGRGVEAAALSVLIDAASARGITTLIGEYRPSGRNGMVEHHYRALGFEPAPAPAGATSEARFWQLAIAARPAPAHHLELETTA